MGCGKTTIGKIVSEKMNLNFYDLDFIIVKKEKNSIFNIFKEKGELYFRNIERLILENLLKNKDQYILSIGGGTPCFYNNIYLLNKYSMTFYLKANSHTLFKRLFLEKNKRPLIAHLSKNELFQFIMKHLSQRIFFYEKSYKNININGKSKNDIAKEIINFVKNDNM